MDHLSKSQGDLVESSILSEIIFGKEFETNPKIRVDLEQVMNSKNDKFIYHYFNKNNINIDWNNLSDIKFHIKSYLEIYDFLKAVNQNSTTVGGCYELEQRSNPRIFNNLLRRSLVYLPEIIELQLVYSIALHIRTIVGGASEVIKYLEFLNLFDNMFFKSILCSEIIIKLCSSYCNDTFCPDSDSVNEDGSPLEKCPQGCKWDEKRRRIIMIEIPKSLFIHPYFIGGKKIELLTLIFRLYDYYIKCINIDVSDIFYMFSEILYLQFITIIKPFFLEENLFYDHVINIDFDKIRLDLDLFEDSLILKIWTKELRNYFNKIQE